ncbi:MAG: 50S ribosomal protein L21 [Candidatus Peribacteraceae bacterium]
MFAIVDIAGFQEKVSEGDALRVPLLDAEPGKTVVFEKVLLLAKSDTDVTIGTPTVSGVSVEVKVIEHGRGDKIRVSKMRRRKRYRRVHGHRQDYTDIEVTKIKVGSGTKSVAAEKVEKKTKATKETKDSKAIKD